MSRDYPKLRDWTKGKYQIGIFVRTPNGTTAIVVSNRPSKHEVEHAMAAVTGKRIEELTPIKPEECFVHAKPMLPASGTH